MPDAMDRLEAESSHTYHTPILRGDAQRVLKHASSFTES